MKPWFWKVAAITQAAVLLAIVGCVLWFYPYFRGARYHLFDRACAFGDDIGVAILLRVGADPDGYHDYEQYIQFAPFEPTPPLVHAVLNDDTNILQLLLAAHADPNPPPYPPDDATPLGIAVVHGYINTARLLRDAGARLDLPRGGSVIELARQHGHTNIVMLLQQKR